MYLNLRSPLLLEENNLLSFRGFRKYSHRPKRFLSLISVFINKYLFGMLILIGVGLILYRNDYYKIELPYKLFETINVTTNSTQVPSNSTLYDTNK